VYNIGGGRFSNCSILEALDMVENYSKIKITKKIQDYFLKKYYQPDIQINLTKQLFKFANTSIDVSDGLIGDLEKMINKQNLSYVLYENNIPISKSLLNLIKRKKLNKSNLVSNGDDYQVLFTASPIKSRIIYNTSKNLGIKITKIGKINSGSRKSIVIDQKGKQILLKNKGYTHKF
jgi:thiamine-monophosphate kinase